MKAIRSSLLAALFLGLVVSTAYARPITHEDVWTFRRLGAPKVSPDGKWAVFSVTEPSYEKDKQVSDLWLVPSDGSVPPRRLTSTPGPEGGVAWSRQGDRIVFTAKRGKDKVGQLYVLDMTGPGEAQRVSDFPLDCSSPHFTPDGKQILFQASVFPGQTDVESQAKAKKDHKERKESVSVYESFPIRHWDHWLDGRHPRPYLLTLGSDTPPVDVLRQDDMTDSSGFAGVSGLSGESLQCAISPDGKSLLFVASVNRDKAVKESTVYRLYSVPLSGGKAQEVPAVEGSVSSPTFGADGKLYTLVEPSNEFVYNLTELRVQEWPVRGVGKSLTAGSDLSVDEFKVASSGRIVITATTAGRKRLFALKDGSPPQALDPDSRGVFSGIGLSGDSVISRYEDGSTPIEIVRVSPKGVVQQLSRFNVARAKGLSWSPFQEFWFTSSGGAKIHNWVVLPPGYTPTQKYPLVLFIHGGPHSSSLDSGHVRWSAQLLAAGGYVVLLTDYTGSVGYGAAFAQAIQGDPFVTPGKELHEAVDEAIKRYPAIDETKVAASGASYGGHLVNWLQATSDRFVCLIGHAGLISLEGQWATSDEVYHRELNQGGPPWEGSPIWKEQSPSSFSSNFSTPVLLTIGEKDYRVPLNQTLAAWTLLQRMNVPSKLLVYHQANHWIMSGPDAAHFWSEVHQWLAKYLKDSPQ
jgi:dipeptidyl aminopeptidase/acylaminoacyl peptidase